MGGYTKAPTRYMFPLFDFGGGSDKVFNLLGPKGKVGLLVNYGVENVEEAMNGDTLDPTVAVGTIADPDAYGDEFTLSNLIAVPSSVRSAFDQEAQLALYLLEPGQLIPADTVVGLKCAAATGANLTGMGCPFVEIIWAD